MKTHFYSFYCLLMGFCLLAGGMLPVNAAHLVGGELTYECLGGNLFRINLTIYRDCFSSGAAFDNPAYITIFNSSGAVVQNISLFNPVVTQLPITTDGLCIETVPNVCVEEGFYQTTATLPPITGGYRIVYQRCCRNNTIVNIVNPGSTGSTYVANVPQSALSPCNNNSPVFTNFPPIAICANSPLVFDHSATDADGDSLVYTICEPLSGANTIDPQPTIASTPPYTPISWLAPYNASNQLGGTPIINIDPVTGLLTASPNQIGQYVVGVCVSEYRNGVLLSTNLRDFQFNVTNCAVVLAQANAAAAGTDIFICSGASVELVGNAFGGSVYQWSPATGLSNPNILNPIASPTQTITYTLTVINPAVNCQDTDQVTVYVTNTLQATVSPDVAICLGESAQLVADATDGTVYLWFPFDGLDNPNIPNPIATPAQTTTYTVFVSNDLGCADQKSVTVTVNTASAQVSVADIAFCPGESGTLATSSGSYTSYLWNNGSTQPQISVSEPGAYSVTVTDAQNGCTASASASATVSLYSLPQPAITGNLTFFTGQTITLQADTAYAAYIWSNGATQPAITVNTTGNYSLTVTNAQGCKGSATVAVTEEPVAPFAIPSAFSPNADGVNDRFMIITPPDNISALQLFVFNRWGQQVFYSNALNQPWNGTFEGADCEMGVYVYYGSVTLKNGQVAPFQGNVTLIR